MRDLRETTMKIIDENGRIGIVSQKTETGVFARPEGTPSEIDDKDGITGVASAKLLTPTHYMPS